MSGQLRLRDLLDSARAVDLLIAGGMREHVATETAPLFADCARAVLTGLDGADADAHAFFVPGRVEVLGKHTDYAGGRSLVAAVERGLCIVASPIDEPIWRVQALDVGGRCAFSIDPDLVPTVGHWSNYPMTVARRVARNFPHARGGATVAYRGNLPLDAGMSSSSTVMVANFLAMSAVNDLPASESYRREIQSSEHLAEYLGTIENGQSFGQLVGNRGVGTFGGSEDHVAMLCGRAGSLVQYSYCPVLRERAIAVPRGCVFVLAACGVASAKTGQARNRFNRASQLARAAVEAWNQASKRSDPHLGAARAGAEPETVRAAIASAKPRDGFSPEEMLERFEHFHAESVEIIPAAGDALASGELAEFGRQVDRSQHCAEDMLHNQIPETVYLAATAREFGAIAASAFGAGFGGSVWALVPGDRVGPFIDRWSGKYAEAFSSAGARATFFVTAAGPAAFELKA